MVENRRVALHLLHNCSRSLRGAHFLGPTPTREIIYEGISDLQSRDREPGRKSNRAQSGGQWGLEQVWQYFGQLSRFEGRILRRPAGSARNHPKFAGIACVTPVALGREHLDGRSVVRPTPRGWRYRDATTSNDTTSPFWCSWNTPGRKQGRITAALPRFAAQLLPARLVAELGDGAASWWRA